MKRIFFIAVLTACVTGAKGQYYYDRSKNPDKVQTTTSSGRDFDHYFSLAWDANTPSSNTTFISSSNSLGARLGFRKRINDVDRLWVGGDFGYSVYKQYVPLSVYQYGTTSISTDTYNYAYNYSLTAVIDYLFRPADKIITPYAGLGIGGAANKFAQYYNIYAGSTTAWGVLIRPEVGVLIGFGENSSWRIKAAFHLDYATTSANLVSNGFLTPGENNYSSFVNTGFQIGIAKMAW